MKNLSFIDRVVALVFILFATSVSFVHSQENIGWQIDFVKVCADPFKGWKHDSSRSPSSAQYLPSTFYDAENGCLVFEGTVSLEGVPYRVEDEEGDILLSGLLTVGKGEEKTVSVCGLPSGAYYIILCMGDEEYAGEFTK